MATANATPTPSRIRRLRRVTYRFFFLFFFFVFFFVDVDVVVVVVVMHIIPKPLLTSPQTSSELSVLTSANAEHDRHHRDLFADVCARVIPSRRESTTAKDFGDATSMPLQHWVFKSVVSSSSSFFLCPRGDAPGRNAPPNHSRRRRQSRPHHVFLLQCSSFLFVLVFLPNLSNHK